MELVKEKRSLTGKYLRGLKATTWLPSNACGKNFSSQFVIDLVEYRKRRRLKELKVPSVVERLRLAEEFRAKLARAKSPAGRTWPGSTA